MSMRGIRLFAGIVSDIRATKTDLLKGDAQDIRLAQILEDMSELASEEFAKVSLTNRRISNDVVRRS